MADEIPYTMHDPWPANIQGGRLNSSRNIEEKTPGDRTIDRVLGVQLIDTIAGGKAVVVDQVAVQRGAVGRVRAVRVQTTRGLVGVDTVMIGIGERELPQPCSQL